VVANATITRTHSSRPAPCPPPPRYRFPFSFAAKCLAIRATATPTGKPERRYYRPPTAVPVRCVAISWFAAKTSTSTTSRPGCSVAPPARCASFMPVATDRLVRRLAIAYVGHHWRSHGSHRSQQRFQLGTVLCTRAGQRRRSHRAGSSETSQLAPRALPHHQPGVVESYLSSWGGGGHDFAGSCGYNHWTQIVVVATTTMVTYGYE
jgi:hypothetical protein